MFNVGIIAVRHGSGELIGNPNFASATGWALGAGWSISSGLATKVSGSSGLLQWVFPSQLPAGTYRIEVTVSSFGSTGIQPRAQSDSSGAGVISGSNIIVSAAENYSSEFVAPSGVHSVRVFTNSTGVASLSRFSLKRIT